MTLIKVKKLNGIEQIKGLMFLRIAHPVLLQTRFGIHTFGVNFPIDVLILDKNHRVVKTKQGLKPNRIFLWNIKYDQVLELPDGEVKRRKIKTGNFVKLILN